MRTIALSFGIGGLLFTGLVLAADKDGNAAKGKEVFDQCSVCHSADTDEKKIGPSLKGLFNVGSYCLEPVKTIPFLPNVGYAFVVLKANHSLTKISWHGRPAIQTDQPRISILNTFYANEDLGF